MSDALGKFLARLGLGVVFLIFGVDKFIHPLDWAAWIPEEVMKKIPIETNPFLYLQGIVEALLGLGVILGFLTRLCALACLAILGAILWFFGLNQVLVRDLGLMGIAAALLIHGAGPWSLDCKIFGKKKIQGALSA